MLHSSCAFQFSFRAFVMTDIDRCATNQTPYSQSTVVDTCRWIKLCKLLIGQHPGHVVIIKDSHTPIIEVHWSMTGVAISILHAALAIGSMIVLMCSNLYEFRRFAIIDLDLSYVQKFIVNGLNVVNVYVLFVKLYWHRRCLHDQHSLMLMLERQFSVIGIGVELQHRRTYIRSVLWAICFVVFNLVYLSNSIYHIISAELPWMWLVVAVVMMLLPTVYKQSMVLFFLYDLAETKRHFIQLNDILRAVLQAERLEDESDL